MNNMNRGLHAVAIATLAALVGCSKEAAAPPATLAAAEAAAPQQGVKLEPGQIKLAGLETVALQAAPIEQITTGQASVMTHDGLAQSLAEIRAAAATAAQSEAALKRLTGLANTPGAMGADAVDVARRQASVDAAQLQLAQRKQQAQFGELAHAAPASMIEALGDGRMKLVRIVFPPDVPDLIDASAVTLVAAEDPSSTRRWRIRALWSAPAEGGIPGRSLFAVIDDAGLSEGRRLLAMYARRAREMGVLVPSAAVVAHDGQYWCYVQTGEGEYERRSIGTGHAVARGYVVAQGVKLGEQVVVQGAGVLLARELGTAEAGD